MADDYTSNPGSGGVTFASDDVGGKHYARLKLVHGADGANDGDVSTANPYPTRLIPVTTGGLDTFRSIDLDETHESVKASAGQVYGLWFSNLCDLDAVSEVLRSRESDGRDHDAQDHPRPAGQLE